MKTSTIPVYLPLALSIILLNCTRDSVEDQCDAFTVVIEQEGANSLQAVEYYGLAPYSYVWSNGSTQGDIIVSESGIYTVTVTDDLGCTASASFEFTDVSNCGITTVTDSDGNVYEVVSIGNQCWMKSNLTVNAGIPEMSDSALWVNATTPGWSYYNNNDLFSDYGKLYNWHAVASGNICPDGWHIPTRAEWDTLINYLGGGLVAGGKMKSTSFDWAPPNTGATNSSGFSAFPAGNRSFNSHFWEINTGTVFWSSTAYTDPAEAWIVTLTTESAGAFVGHSNKKSGYSCRCVKD